jgi:16S rRNA (guanine527-N7)-methyltransferase
MLLSAAQLDQFEQYARELLAWNAHMNLTAITDSAGLTVRHMLDSLRCARSWGEAPRRIVDVGSGAGFPGLPLKLLQPSLAVTLVESVEKKAAFLRHVVAQLGLSDVQVLTLRAEQAGRDAAHREQYDVALARGVADLCVLAEYCLPLCRAGGRFLAPKGADVRSEVARAEPVFARLGGRLLAVEPVELPGVEPRSLVVVEKVLPTPGQYPRAVGIPSRRPLGGRGQ